MLIGENILWSLDIVSDSNAIFIFKVQKKLKNIMNKTRKYYALV